MKTKTIHFANIFEFNRRQLWRSDCLLTSRLSPPDGWAVSSEAAAYWTPDDNYQCLVTPAAVDDLLLHYFRDRFGWQIQSVTPKLQTGCLSLDVIADESSVDSIISDSDAILVKAWGLTEPLMALVSHLKKRIPVLVDWKCGRLDGAALVDYLDTKIGSRAILSVLAQENMSCKLPLEVVLTDNFTVNCAMAELLQKLSSGIVLKANRGWAGRGTVAVTGVPDPDDFKRVISALGAQVQDSTFVCQQLLGSQLSPDTPSVDVHMYGKLEKVKIWPNQMLTQNGSCVGIAAGVGVLDSELHSQMISIADSASRLMRMIGYQGWFDIDFVLWNQQLFATETNIRRTGGTAPLLLMDHLYGADWGHRKYVCTYEKVWLPRPIKPQRIIESITRIQCNYNSLEEGLMPLTIGGSMLAAPYIGLIIYANSSEAAADIYQIAKAHLC